MNTTDGKVTDAIAALTALRDEWVALREEEYNSQRADQSAGWFRADGRVKAYEDALALLDSSPYWSEAILPTLQPPRGDTGLNR